MLAQTGVDSLIITWWPVILLIGGFLIWGARLESRVKNTILKQRDYERRQDKLEERIAIDLDKIKDDSSIIKQTLEHIQGYMRATREFQERK